MRALVIIDNAKPCTKCKKTKPLSEFYKANDKKMGYQSRCKECVRAYFRENGARFRGNITPERRARINANQIEARKKDIEWSRVRQKLINHGLTLDQYAALDESQNWSCGSCERDDVPLVVDHNHESGKVRGLLCEGCNKGLGHFGDSVDNLLGGVNYLLKKGSYAEYSSMRSASYVKRLSYAAPILRP